MSRVYPHLGDPGDSALEFALFYGQHLTGDVRLPRRAPAV
jgi:hypothetical protein